MIDLFNIKGKKYLNNNPIFVSKYDFDKRKKRIRDWYREQPLEDRQSYKKEFFKMKFTPKDLETMWNYINKKDLY